MARTLLLLLSAAFPLVAQVDPNGHVWLQYFGDHPVGSSRWSLHLEGQFRRHHALLNWQNLLLRPAVNFRLNQKLELSAGYGFVEFYRYGQYPAPRKGTEHRLYQDLKLRLPAGRTSLTQRFRFEERWLPAKNYENRFRYQIREVIPFRKVYSLILTNEVFLPVAPTRFPGRVDQNRVQFLVGKKLHPRLRLETGYMLQTIWQRNGRIREDNHTLVLAFWSDAPIFPERR